MCPCIEHFTGKKLPEETIAQIFNDIARYNSEVDRSKKGVHTIRFDGNNESLLIPDIHKYIAAAKHENPDVCMYLVTNGLLLNKEMTDKLIASGINKIHVSITGTTPEIYRNFQGYELTEDRLKINFEKANANTRYFLEKANKISQGKPDVVLSFLVNEDSYENITEYAMYWMGLGANIDIRGCGSNHIIKKNNKRDGIIAYRHCNLFGHMLIKANGDLLLSCCASEVPVLGNVLQDSLYDILTSQKFVEMEEAFTALRVESLPEICANCPQMHVYQQKETKREKQSTEKDNNEFDNRGFKNNTLREFYRQLAGRKLVIFGAGMKFYEAIKILDANIPISCIVDNDKNKHGMNLKFGETLYPVQPVEFITNSDFGDLNDVVVLLTMEMFWGAEKQLNKMGVSRYFLYKLFPEIYYHLG
jgi:MoaA/NifB/PqqE/SkfB family radical SAM enzyme